MKMPVRRKSFHVFFKTTFTFMKNLANLLSIKKNGAKHVITTDQGIVPLSTGVKGIVSEIDAAILKELFNEEPLSNGNLELFQTLKKVKAGKLEKVAKVVKQKS
jgi:hypothetical protein